MTLPSRPTTISTLSADIRHQDLPTLDRTALLAVVARLSFQTSLRGFLGLTPLSTSLLFALSGLRSRVGWPHSILSCSLSLKELLNLQPTPSPALILRSRLLTLIRQHQHAPLLASREPLLQPAARTSRGFADSKLTELLSPCPAHLSLSPAKNVDQHNRQQPRAPIEVQKSHSSSCARRPSVTKVNGAILAVPVQLSPPSALSRRLGE